MSEVGKPSHAELAEFMTRAVSRKIVFEINGERYKATVDDAHPVSRTALDVRGQLTVEHPSESYAIYLDPRGYVARPIVEDA